MAAQHVADDRLTDVQIAAQLGRSRFWLASQKRNPVFMARVKEIVDETVAALKAEGIARRENRQAVLQDLHERNCLIMDERAADPDHADVPGWKSGLLTHDVKSVRGGRVYRSQTAGVHGIRLHDEDGQDIAILDIDDAPEFEIHHIYEYDAALVKEERAVLDQMAQERGEKTEKRETSFKQDSEMLAVEREWMEIMRAAGVEDGANPNAFDAPASDGP